MMGRTANPPHLRLLNVLLGSIGAGYMVYGRRNNHLLATICGLLLRWCLP